jgi:iron-sulfur cluster assembly protein
MHEPGGSGARGREAAERAASRSTGRGGIVLPGRLHAFALVAVTGRRLLLQALPGFLVAAGIDSLPGVAGVSVARLTERLAHTLLVQLSCLVVLDHALCWRLATGSTPPHLAVSRCPCREGSRGRDLFPEGARLHAHHHRHGRRGHKGDRRLPAVPQGAGRRIATRPDIPAEHAFEVSVAAVPAEEAEVVEQSGAQVFLEPHATEALDDKVLADEGGKVRFAVGDQT